MSRLVYERCGHYRQIRQQEDWDKPCPVCMSDADDDRDYLDHLTVFLGVEPVG